MSERKKASGFSGIENNPGGEVFNLPDATSLPEIKASGDIMGRGWIRLWRKMLDDVIWKTFTSEQKVITITLLLMANHENNEWFWKGKKFIVKKGQMITSIDSVKHASGRGITTQNVRTALVKLEKVGFLTNQSTKEGRLISIVKWKKYQPLNIPPNKELTKASQRPNKALTPNKNDKNDKNDKKSIDNVLTLYRQFELVKNKFTTEELKLEKEFIDYWTEKSIGGHKERWQKEPVFDVQKRFRTWIRNNRTNFGRRKPKKSFEEIVKERGL